MQHYSVIALIYITQLVYISNAILEGIIQILGLTEEHHYVPTKPMDSKGDLLKLINKRLAEYEKKRHKEDATGGKHNIANLNTLKNNISLPEIQMPSITVVVVKDKKALEKYQQKANDSSTLIIKKSSKAPTRT